MGDASLASAGHELDPLLLRSSAFSCMASVSINFHSLDYISFRNRLSLWSWSNCQMQTWWCLHSWAWWWYNETFENFLFYYFLLQLDMFYFNFPPYPQLPCKPPITWNQVIRCNRYCYLNLIASSLLRHSETEITTANTFKEVVMKYKRKHEYK